MFLMIHDLFGSVESAVLGEQGAGIQERLLRSDLHVGGSKHGGNATLCTK